MGNIIFVTGGARSGKSTFAEKYCIERTENRGYIATAEVFDEEMKNRVKKHQQQRGNNWITYEKFLEIESVAESIFNTHEYTLLDCITVYISNMMLNEYSDFDNIGMDIINSIEEKIQNSLSNIIQTAKTAKGNLVIVSNEIGLGIVPDNKLARVYRDYVGRANQLCAREADEVYLVVSSIPLKIK